jgi:hypothetical protein
VHFGALTTSYCVLLQCIRAHLPPAGSELGGGLEPNLALVFERRSAVSHLIQNKDKSDHTDPSHDIIPQPMGLTGCVIILISLRSSSI